jgi:hypothetical protein
MTTRTVDASSEPMLPHYYRHGYEEAHDDVPLDDNESDITKIGTSHPYTKTGRIRERSPSDMSSWSFTSPRQRSPRKRWGESYVTWFRWSITVLLQSAILFFLWRQNSTSDPEHDAVLRGKTIETGDDINGLYKTSELPWCHNRSTLELISCSISPVYIFEARYGDVHTQHDDERKPNGDPKELGQLDAA